MGDTCRALVWGTQVGHWYGEHRFDIGMRDTGRALEWRTQVGHWNGGHR